MSWASPASTSISTTGWVSICALSSVPSLHPYSLTFINFHPNVLLSSRWNVYDTTEVHPATSLSTRQPPVFNYLSIIHTNILERELRPHRLVMIQRPNGNEQRAGRRACFQEQARLNKHTHLHCFRCVPFNPWEAPSFEGIRKCSTSKPNTLALFMGKQYSKGASDLVHWCRRIAEPTHKAKQACVAWVSCNLHISAATLLNR